MKHRRPISIECGALIRELRQKAELSQSALAAKIQSDAAYISLIELGGRNATLVSLERIVNGLNLSLADFLDLLATRLASR